MDSIVIDEVKEFMATLLLSEVFDDYMFNEAVIVTSSTFNFEGKINKEWYSNEELETMGDRRYILWSDIRKNICSLIKGNKTPSHMRIVLACYGESYNEFKGAIACDNKINDIDKLLINIKFDKDGLTITSGISYKNFTLDKSIEHEWDIFIKNFVSTHLK